MGDKANDLREEADHTWTVYEVSTGVPTLHNGLFTVGLSLGDATNLVDHLNSLADAPSEPKRSS